MTGLTTATAIPFAPAAISPTTVPAPPIVSISHTITPTSQSPASLSTASSLDTAPNLSATSGSNAPSNTYGPLAADPADDNISTVPETIATVSVDQVTDLRAAEIRFQYDPSAIQLEKQDIQAGDAWGDQAAVLSNIDTETGIVTAFVFSVEPIENTEGDLIDIHLPSPPDFASSASPKIELQEVRLNEEEVTFNKVAPAPHRSAIAPIAPAAIASPVMPPVHSRPHRFDENFIGPIRPEYVDSALQDPHFLAHPQTYFKQRFTASRP
ncbi:cohesin domain-containing protein [Rhodopirellula sallentina]|uniref:Fibrinogen-binding protein n=1 Tax=Rhodopirellula sallentina SM41 TaxID=1263870 RepID=M5U4K9_9BACT|nr:cohesin domain-containing protein [Rhodopirellula sallentina]EMI56390.1 fibrinogen-binding protein [Rhodopirellula sallentina SM41]